MLQTRKTFWHSLTGSPEDELFLHQSLYELRSHIHPSFAIEKFAQPESSLIFHHLACGNLDAALHAINALPTPTAIVAHCTPDHPAACASLRRLPHALWGLTLRGRLAIVYAPNNKHLLWHETLHLLGAQDHYDLRTFKTTCDLPTCIMQYAPSDQTVGPHPFLCNATRRILSP